MSIVIIDYKVGNIRSVANALEAIGSEVIISHDPSQLKRASHLILPGVGTFEDGMKNLRALGLVELLHTLVMEEKRPFLGICLGMQLLAEIGYENGEHRGLGWINAEAVRFPQGDKKLKVPHVGWNDVLSRQDNPLLGTTGSLRSFYFVHSYYLECTDPSVMIGQCDYGIPFTAAIRQENIFATQFHPEKSHRSGLNLLKNFVSHSEIESAKTEHADTGAR